MHRLNYSIYHLLRYQIELGESLEYSLVTYKLEIELNERLRFLNNDYKSGFFYIITKHLLSNSKEHTKEIKNFHKKYKKRRLLKMIESNDLKDKIEFNRDLYLAFTCSNEIIDLFLKEEEIKSNIEEALVRLVNTSEKHFNMAYLFNSLNQFLSSKYALASNTEIHTLSYESKELLIAMLSSIEVENKNLYNDAIDLIKGNKELSEDDSYELLNKISMEYTKLESSLYQNFDNFSKKLEKEMATNWE